MTAKSLRWRWKGSASQITSHKASNKWLSQKIRLSLQLVSQLFINKLARENKSIEIWTMPNSWSQIALIPGNQNCDIRSLQWLEPDAEASPKA